jgi:hypothetical protein
MTDVPTDAEIDRQAEVAFELMDEYGDQISEIDEDVDPIGVAYCLWVHLTHILADAGWGPEELARDAAHHAAMETSEGQMQ